MNTNSEPNPRYHEVDFDSDISEAVILPFPQKIKSEGQEDPPPSDMTFDKFLDAFCEDRPWHLLAILDKEHPIEAKDLPPSETRVTDARTWGDGWVARGYAIYFAINPLKYSLGKKASKDDVLESRWVWADIDPPKDLNDLDAWRVETLQSASTGGALKIPPTAIVDSGRGVWLYWKLATPVTLDGKHGPATRRVESFGKRLLKAFECSDSTCKNIDRIARLPGFANSRTGRIAKVIELHEDRTFALTDFPSVEYTHTEKREAIGTLDNALDIENFKLFLSRQHGLKNGQPGYIRTLDILNRAGDFGISPEMTASILMSLSTELGRSQRSPEWEYEYLVSFAERLEPNRNDPVGCASVASFYEEPGLEEITRERIWEQDAQKDGPSTSAGGSETFHDSSWGTPEELPPEHLPVLPFDLEYLPSTIGPWVGDIAERMQVPQDLPGIAAIIALGSVLGRKFGMAPKRLDNWHEVSNLWGVGVGTPGVKKSPAVSEATAPLEYLEGLAQERNKEESKDYAIALREYKIRKEAEENRIKAALRKGEDPDFTRLNNLEEPEAPRVKQYIMGNSTYEQCGVILENNPNGVLLNRDEIVPFLKSLDDESKPEARGFYLESWSGKKYYDFSRIGRGRTYIPHSCISLLGTTQPGSISEYFSKTVAGSSGNDGLIQRMNLLTWPVPIKQFRNIDRAPNGEMKKSAWDTFARLDRLTAEEVGAEIDEEFCPIPFFHYDAEAQGGVDEWLVELEAKISDEDLGAGLQTHLSKYRGLVPTLSLINHLADGGHGRIGLEPLVRAMAFTEYLESHARKAYELSRNKGLSPAGAILRKIKEHELGNGFTARSISQRHWANLFEENVQAGLDMLTDYYWIRGTKIKTGGRPTQTYEINPRAYK
jgi:hypothetical protein